MAASVAFVGLRRRVASIIILIIAEVATASFDFTLVLGIIMIFNTPLSDRVRPEHAF